MIQYIADAFTDTHNRGRKAYFLQTGASAAQLFRNLRDGGSEGRVAERIQGEELACAAGPENHKDHSAHA